MIVFVYALPTINVSTRNMFSLEQYQLVQNLIQQ
jgi:hypothetical protein